MKPIMQLHSCRPFRTQVVSAGMLQADTAFRKNKELRPLYPRLFRLRGSQRPQDIHWAEWMLERAGLNNENHMKILHDFLGVSADAKLSQCCGRN